MRRKVPRAGHGAPSGLCPLTSGFTMLEMLVAVAATLIMVLFLNQIFSSMSSSVALGMATSDITHASHTFSKQIEDDASAMIKARDNPPGILVILQQEIPHPEGAHLPPLRSDQIAWIRTNTAGLQPRTPEHEDTYDERQIGMAPLRVWYGHVVPTNPNGMPGNMPINPAHWTLGRQGLFFDPNPPPAPASIYINVGNPHDNTSWTVAGFTGSNSPPSSVASWRGGLSDIINEGYGTFTNVPLVDVVELAHQLTFYEAPLACNTDPVQEGNYHPWRIAQTHPLFIRNVSHFEINFAGDFGVVDSTGTILTENAEGDALIDAIDGQIVWYDAFGDPNGTDPRKPKKPDDWTSLPPTAFQDSTMNDSVRPFWNEGAGQHSFVWHAGGLGLNWPYMIRFRYRIHDPNGQLSDQDGNRGKLFERIVRIRRVVDLF